MKRPVGHLEHGHAEAKVPGRCDCLQPDVTRAHDDDLLCPGEVGTNTVDVGHRAQVVDTLEVVTGHFQQAVAAAEAQDQLVVAQFRAVAQAQPLVRPVDCGDPQSELHVHQVLFVELGAAQQQPLAVHFTREVLLGQRRPVVGQVRLVADHDDAACVPFAAQRIDCLHCRVARTDNHHRLLRHANLCGPCR